KTLDAGKTLFVSQTPKTARASEDERDRIWLPRRIDRVEQWQDLRSGNRERGLRDSSSRVRCHPVWAFRCDTGPVKQQILEFQSSIPQQESTPEQVSSRLSVLKSYRALPLPTPMPESVHAQIQIA